MLRDHRVYLLDAIRAAEHISRFVEGRSVDEYNADVLLHSAVERQFEIIGEALRQLGSLAPDLASSIPSYRSIVAFRNQLAHGYFAVKHDVVWAIATRDVPQLLVRLRELLGAAS